MSSSPVAGRLNLIEQWRKSAREPLVGALATRQAPQNVEIEPCLLAAAPLGVARTARVPRIVVLRDEVTAQIVGDGQPREDALVLA
jgi:hypothetical protein